jgi:polyisoprenoid-binding protein YceI
MGVTIVVVLVGVVVYRWVNTMAGLVASTTVNREDFGLTWNAALETGGFLVGKTVTIDLEVELGKQQRATTGVTPGAGGTGL